MNTLHIYSPVSWHSTARIKGTLESLILLRDSLDAIIKKQKKFSQFESFTSDSEGFVCEISRCSDEQMNNLLLPYTDLNI